MNHPDMLTMTPELRLAVHVEFHGTTNTDLFCTICEAHDAHTDMNMIDESCIDCQEKAHIDYMNQLYAHGEIE